MRTLNPDTVRSVFLCDFRKIGTVERVVEAGEGTVAAFSRTGGKEKASRRVVVPNLVEGRLMLSFLNAGAFMGQCKHLGMCASSAEIPHLRQFHLTGLLPRVLSPVLRGGPHRCHLAVVLV